MLHVCDSCNVAQRYKEKNLEMSCLHQTSLEGFVEHKCHCEALDGYEFDPFSLMTWHDMGIETPKVNDIV